MEIVFSWAHSDPFYPYTIPECGLLVSVPNVSGVWTARRFPMRPRSLMIDSGGYQILRGEELAVHATLQRQVDMVADAPHAVICVLDAPLPKVRLSVRERHERLEKTIANAHAYHEFAREYGPDRRWELLAVIQGDDRESIRFCAEELARIGFDRYGVGGLAPLYHTKEILRRVGTAMDVVGHDLHVFGVAGLATMRELGQLGVRSVDTARPMHAAFCNEILYSAPYRRYGVAGTVYPGSRRPKFNTSQQIDAPLPCDCSPCRADAARLLGMRGQAAIHHRALHNAYHLAREVRLMGHDTGEGLYLRRGGDSPG